MHHAKRNSLEIMMDDAESLLRAPYNRAYVQRRPSLIPPTPKTPNPSRTTEPHATGSLEYNTGAGDVAAAPDLRHEESRSSAAVVDTSSTRQVKLTGPSLPARSIPRTPSQEIEPSVTPP